MNMLLDDNATEQLQAQTIAVQMDMTRFGTSKNFEDSYITDIARTLEASADRIKAMQVIVNTKHPAYSAVTSHMSKVKREFKEKTVSYPEPSVRLLHIDNLEKFQQYITEQCQILETLVTTLDSHRDELVDDARRKLGRPFREDYYPRTFVGKFTISVSYPSIGPDERLQRLNPELYEQQKRRFASMMEQAIEETTAALASELQDILGSIASQLTQGKQLRTNMFDPLNNFLDRFADVRLGSSRAIQDVVDQARSILSARGSVAIARSASVRTAIAQSLAPLHENVSQFVQDAPYRMIQL